MNLHQINTGALESVIKKANYDIRNYTDFINKAIDFLKNEAFSINLKKEFVDVEIEKDGKKHLVKEVRYSTQVATNIHNEKAIDLLFNESTKSIFDQKNKFDRNDAIQILEQNEEEKYIILQKEIESTTIYLRPDTFQLEQQRKALDNLRFRPLKEHQPILELFGFPYNNFWDQNCYHKVLDWQILTDTSKDGVYEQRSFVSKAVQTKDFALLEGPPGSGKTTTIIELIMQYASEGKRVLLCSATHAAIDNVIERIKGRYKEVCDKEIVPVRISSFERPVKESVRPYLLKNLVATYKAEIEKSLKKKQALDSQKFLLKNLHENVDKDPIEQIILDSANLVAGTMIGILQHPDIKANSQGASFDVLIIDEASKVTFSDFIVPALHAKRWVLVGDVKQLSPFVENDYVSENIAQMIDAETQNLIVKQFELKVKLNDNKFNDCLKVYFTDKKITEESKFIDKDYIIEKVDENWNPTEENIIKINAADVLICKNDTRIKQLLAANIYVKSIFINGELNSLHQFYRQEYQRKSHKKAFSYSFDSREEEWSEMVSSRLNQSFSFRNAEGFENIDKELSYLIPEKIIENINDLKRIVFPSILELLQNGVGKGIKQNDSRVLSDGFHPQYKDSRFVSLSYQHRMHPDIAKTSQENFYHNNLLPANTVLENKSWKYAPNEPVVKWIHDNDNSGNLKGKPIINTTEISNVERELIKFLSWAKDNPKINSEGKLENYEVAVLTFYLNQETQLRNCIRRITKQNSFSKFNLNNVEIYLYTVDKFQGQEADLVLLGFTKCSPNAFYNSPNRLNVALTRARHKLVLFGNRAYLKNSKLNAMRDLAHNFESIISY